MTFFPRTVTFWLRYWLFIDGQINRYALYPRRLVPPSLVNQYFGLGFDFHLLSRRRMSVNRNKNRNYVLTHRSSTTDDCWLLPRLRNLQSIGVFAIFGVVGYVDNWGCPPSHPIPSHSVQFSTVRSDPSKWRAECSGAFDTFGKYLSTSKSAFRSPEQAGVQYFPRQAPQPQMTDFHRHSQLPPDFHSQPLPSRGSACFALGLWLN